MSPKKTKAVKPQPHYPGNETTFKRLEKMHRESQYASIAEVARRILSNRQIMLYYTDVSMNAPMEEMALIRKELKAIGININQIT